MSLWDELFGRTPPPGTPGGPPRQLTLPRLLNLLANPFAIGSTGPTANFQKNVYQYPGYGSSIPILADGFKQPFPMWIGCDLQLGAFKTARGHFPMPANFFVLSYFASCSSVVNGGFKAVLYDTNRRIPLTMKPVNFNTLAGVGSSPLFMRAPYSVNPDGGEVKLKWTVTSLENVAANVEFGMYGIQVSDNAPPTPSALQRVAQAMQP